MTTVAFKNGQLAADQMVSSNNNFYASVRKVFKKGDILYGAAGSLPGAQMFFDWIGAGMDMQNLPPNADVKDDSGESYELSYEGLIFYKDWIISYLPPGVFTRKRLPPSGVFATGSGSDIARGAMLAGLTAAEAVALAAQIDVSTGGGVDVVEK